MDNKVEDQKKAAFQKELEGIQENYEKISSETLEEKLAKLTQLAGGPTKDTLLSLINAAAEKGIMPRHALKLSDEAMEAVYSQAYTLYNQGRYKEAIYVFRLLTLLDYLTPKYTLGLAACFHRLKDYKNAANIYLLCGTTDPHNPLPHYHAADCYIQLGIPLMAIFSLRLAINAAENQPEYSVIKERATLMRDALEKQTFRSQEEKEPEEKKPE